MPNVNSASKDLRGVRSKAGGLSALAMSFVLPHENKPMRLPVVPATLTATLDGMNDGTWPVPDSNSKKAFLCRDPCYPLWVQKSMVNTAGYLQSTGSATSWIISAKTNSVLQLPEWDLVAGGIGATPTVDGAVATAAMMADNTVIGNAPGSFAIFVSPGSTFNIRIFTGLAGGGSGLDFEIGYQVGGEEFTATCTAISVADGFIFSGPAGGLTATVGLLSEGRIPYGFSWIKAMRTTTTAPAANSTPILQFGWSSGGTLGNPSGTALVYAPFAMPPEFNNSVLPYGRTRLNASAALFSNVTAALSKEGTVLAARLKPSVVDPWSFSIDNINSVHPSMRYFGPLEKGLYTFTTPSGNVDNFSDCWTTMTSVSLYNSVQRPLFDYSDIGLYNAMVFSDLGSASAGTQLAVSSYVHLEFETTSSLFTPGVSTLSLETLHAAEVALLRFGHFHENPVHWAALASAAVKALKFVAPMVAPVVQHYGQKALDYGVDMLKTTRKPAGDRKMTQELAPRPNRPARPRPNRKKARAVKNKRKA